MPPRRAVPAAAAAMQRAQRMDVTPMQALENAVAYMARETRLHSIADVKPDGTPDTDARKTAFGDMWDRYIDQHYDELFAERDNDAGADDYDRMFAIAYGRFTGDLVSDILEVADTLAYGPLITTGELKQVIDMLETYEDDGTRLQLLAIWKARISPAERKAYEDEERAAEAARIAALPPPRPVMTLTEDQLMRGYTTAVAQLDEHAQDYRSNGYDNVGVRTIDQRMAQRVVQAITVAMQIRGNQVADEGANAVLNLALNANNVWIHTGGLITGGNRKPYEAVAMFLYPHDVHTPTRDTPAARIFLVRAVPTMLAAFVRQFGHEPGAQALARLGPQVHDRNAVERAMLHRAPFARGPIADLVTQMLAPDAVSRDRPFRALMNQAQRERDAPHLTNEDRLDIIIRSIDAHTDPLFIRRQLEALRASVAATAAAEATKAAEAAAAASKRRRVGEKSKQ